MSTVTTEYQPGRLYGLTHELGGAPIVRVPRTVKVGIGMAKGPGLHVYLNKASQWCIAVDGQDDKVRHFDTRQACHEAFATLLKTVPARKYPRKLSYFTFTRITGDGLFAPDWEAIEAHGPFPTEIDIVFVTDDPLHAHYQMWTAAELKCEGDGISARRVLSMARTPGEDQAAKDAAERGEKYFPILGGCRERGCGYAKEGEERSGKVTPAACKPHGRLLFQLLGAPRLGGTATFDTTSFRSISQLFSGIQTFRSVTGNGDAERGYVAGIPLKLLVRPFKHSRGVSYAVSVEFRAESAAALRRSLIEHADAYRGMEARQLTAGPVAVPVDTPARKWDGHEEAEYSEPPDAVQAEMMESEFYPEEDFTEPETLTREERIAATAGADDGVDAYPLIPAGVQASFRDAMGPRNQRTATLTLQDVQTGLADDLARDPLIDTATVAKLRLSVFVTAMAKKPKPQVGGEW